MFWAACEQKFDEGIKGLRAEVSEQREKSERTMEDPAFCKMVVSSFTFGTHVGGAKPMVVALKPKEFSSKRNVKELENYICQLERFF